MKTLIERLASMPVRVFGPTIQAKIVSVFALIIGVMTVFTAWYFPSYYESRGKHDLVRRANSIGNMTAFNVSAALLFDDEEHIKEAFSSARQNPDVVYIAVLDTLGRSVATDRYPPPFEVMKDLDMAVATGRVFEFELPITSQGIFVGSLRLGLYTEEIHNDISGVRAATTIMSAVLFLAAIVSSGWMARKITRPLTTMVNVASEISQGNLNRRVDATASDEVGELARSFNRMVERLESSYRSVEEINRTLESRVEARTRELRQEVAERKRAEDQLRKLSEAVEQSSASIFITDASGRVEYANPRFTELTGYTLDDLKGSTVDLLYPDESDSGLTKRILASMREGRSWVGELRGKRKNGLEFWEEASISPIRDAHGRITHFVSVNEDVTEKKVLQQELLQAQKLESIGILAAGVAHEFNNVLGIISTHAAMLGGGDQLKGTAKRYVDIILSSVGRGASVVRQILTFARKTEVRKEPVDVNAVLREVTSLLSKTFPKTLSMEVSLSEDLPWILIDQTQLHQALLNLCVNARDATEETGTITLTTSVVAKGSILGRYPDAGADRYVCIRVADNGSGMSDDVVKRIFEPFFTTKDVGKGTGLGLAVVYGIVQSHSGFIAVESAIDVGTTFELFLPVPESVAAAGLSSQQSEKVSGGRNETVLLVEDESDIREMMQNYLRLQNYTVLTAADGVDGLMVFEQNMRHITIVVADVGLPRMDGRAMVQEMRRMRPDIRAIVCSGYFGQDVDGGQAWKDGILSLPKPYVPSDIARRIREGIDSIQPAKAG